MGKNRLSCDGAARPAKRSAMQDILAALRKGDRYRTVKQPIFDLTNHDKMGYEFLSRLDVEGFELPEDFFRVCLENNLLTQVDYQCLKNCVNAGLALPKNIKRHLNIFPSTLIDISHELLSLFPEDTEKNKSFCVEISEQQILGDPGHLVVPLSAFRSSGIRIAIDDVGFGRSCLESLIVLEPDIVKVDKRWVIGIAGDEHTVKALKRLLKIARSLETEVVAEGIESEEDLHVLKDLGVPFGQGYFLGRPA